MGRVFMIDIKIVVNTHKRYRMPEASMYLPLYVGSAGKPDIGYARDDTGDNISVKNSGYCELTGLYWAWKNLDADYLGLAHYRRHFSLHQGKDKWKSVLNDEQAQGLCARFDIILPQKRRYFIETLYSHYEHTHYIEHITLTRQIIGERCPEYIRYFDSVLKQRSGYMFNMFIMKRELLDEYCSWLFDILGELENRVVSDGLSAFQKRFYGRVSEILLNVWLAYRHDRCPVKTVVIGYMHMEHIHWGKKAAAFLEAKLFGKKYERSF